MLKMVFAVVSSLSNSCHMCITVINNLSILSVHLVKVMKVRGDGTLRPLSDLLTNVEIRDRSYIDIDIDENCPCDLLSGGKFF